MEPKVIDIEEKRVDEDVVLIQELLAHSDIVPESYKRLKEIYPHIPTKIVTDIERLINLDQGLDEDHGHPIFKNKKHCVEIVIQSKADHILKRYVNIDKVQ